MIRLIISVLKATKHEIDKQTGREAEQSIKSISISYKHNVVRRNIVILIQRAPCKLSINANERTAITLLQQVDLIFQPPLPPPQKKFSPDSHDLRGWPLMAQGGSGPPDLPGQLRRCISLVLALRCAITSSEGYSLKQAVISSRQHEPYMYRRHLCVIARMY